MSRVAASAPVVLRWAHQETKPEILGFSLRPEAFDLARTPIERNRVLRALMVYSAYAVDELTTVGPKTPVAQGEMSTALRYELGGSLDRDARFPTPEHRFAASTIARSWMLFPDRAAHIDVYSCATRDGDPAQLQEPIARDRETGFPPLLLAGIAVAGIAASVYATVYCAQMALDVIDRKLTRDAETQRMVAAQQRAVQMADEHAMREQQAGKPLPWTDQQTQAFEALLQTQRTLADKRQEPIEKYKPFQGATDALDRAIQTTTETILPVALLAAGAYFVLSR